MLWWTHNTRILSSRNPQHSKAIRSEMGKMDFKLIFITISVGFTSSWALSKDYIDLLPDNDEFLWTSHLNEYENVRSNGSESVMHRHSVRKRQTEQLLLENKGYGACKTPLGEAGNCRHMIYCRMPELKNDVWKLVSQLCIIEKSSIGICCPDRVNSRLGPQIIVDINSNGLDEPRIVNVPEQRGCGITTKEFPRITGGRPAESDEWPWMAALLKPQLPHVWCGGVLVTDRHVLTAAHCVYKLSNQDIFVRLGEYNTRLTNETRARDFAVANMVAHIDYDPQTYLNDIALVRIQRPTIFNTYIWPVCIPPIGESWEGQMGVVTGWGSQHFGGPHSNILMEVSLPIWKNSDCQEVLVDVLPDSTMCAGVATGGQDSCQGDSGGPLLVQLPNRRWITVGVVSWGIRCGEPNRPGVYTRVDKYLHWIIENSDI